MFCVLTAPCRRTPSHVVLVYIVNAVLYCDAQLANISLHSEALQCADNELLSCQDYSVLS